MSSLHILYQSHNYFVDIKYWEYMYLRTSIYRNVYP